jgi:hypothetical protein
VAIDPRKLRPGELCRLLNSTALGEVITTQQLQQHRTRAGLRLGNARTINLSAYVAWLVLQRHAPSVRSKTESVTTINLTEAAQGAAALASRLPRGHGQKLTSKQESVIAALLTEPTHAAAAAKAGIGEATLYRWLMIPQFREAYYQARREIVDAAVGRLQAAAGQAVDTLAAVSRHGKRDSDRVRASIALLDRARHGLADRDILHGGPDSREAIEMKASDVVALLAKRLRHLEQSELSTAEKSRLTVALADAFLRAFSVDVLDKRLEALDDVLVQRKEKKR